MNKIKSMFLSIILMLCLYSCKTITLDFRPEWQSGLFHLDECTDIDSFVDINGYYVAANYSDSTRFVPFLFYEDGTFGEMPFRKNYNANFRIENLDMYKDSIVCYQNDSIIYYQKRVPYTFCTGGHYVISKDTLIVDKYFEIFRNVWVLVKLKFLPVDRLHLRMVQCQYFSVKHDGIITVDKNEIYEFVPVKRKLPSMGVGIRNQKFVWRSKKDFVEWKRYVKSQKGDL